MQDYTNLLLSFQSLSNDTALAISIQQSTLAGLLGDSCHSADSAGDCLALSGTLLSTNSHGGIGYQGASVSELTVGHRVLPNVDVGATLNVGRIRLPGSSFGDSTEVAGGIWANFSQNRSFGTGLLSHIAVGAAEDRYTISQGEGYSNVVPLIGKANVESISAQGSVSYGAAFGNGWLVTPTVGFTYIDTVRGGYAENTGIFPASFASLEYDTAYASFGLSVQKSIGTHSSVFVASGLDVNIHADRAGLNGTSTLPGMTTFALPDGYSRNDVRPSASAGYSYAFWQRSNISASVQVGTPIYGHTQQYSLGLRYGFSF